MPLGLKRYQREGDDHFITFSCYRREPNLITAASKDTFLDSLEQTRRRYRFEILGLSKRLTQRPFWQVRYYDFNVFTHNKRVEKLKYMHRNPVTRGLAAKPEDWQWSSYRHYLLDEPTPVQVTRI